VVADDCEKVLVVHGSKKRLGTKKTRSSSPSRRR
jgi:hypothetical protein